MFTLAISCLTTSNLPWFMDLIFQVPVQYCSLQNWTLLPSPDTSTTGCCFRFGSISSFFPELFLHSSPVAYWTPTKQPGEFIFQCHIFLPFHTVHGVLKARILKWFAIPFSSGPCFVELSTMTRPSWVALVSWLIGSLSLTRLWAMWSVWLVFCDCGFHSVCPLTDKRLMEASWWERLTEGETVSYPDGPGCAQ